MKGNWFWRVINKCIYGIYMRFRIDFDSDSKVSLLKFN